MDLCEPGELCMCLGGLENFKLKCTKNAELINIQYIPLTYNIDATEKKIFLFFYFLSHHGKSLITSK